MAAARRADWGRISEEEEEEEAQLMLPARVVGTNRLISSSGAKDGHKVAQPALTHAGQCGNNIISEDCEREFLFVSSHPGRSVCLRPAVRAMLYVSSPWNELVLCLSTCVCLRFHLRNDFDFVCV